MTTFSSPPVHIVPRPAPPARWRRFVPRTRRRKAAVAAGVTVLLVAGVLGASYDASPGGALWGVEKTVFPEHAQDVALTAVVDDLKAAQDILGSGQQPAPDQLTAARTSLNEAKQGLDYLSASPQRTSLQNLYLQLNQQLLQYTPASAQQLPALPPPPAEPQAADPGGAPQTPDVALMSAAAPTWGYQDPGAAGNAAPIDQMSDSFVPPPPDVPAAPAADWSQPVDPPLTPNLQDLGYYDPSWGQLYGYNSNDWYNYDLGGYNQYGYDFLGFDRWGHDRWGYDRWGYDRWGYNWSGYNWSGYDRDGWDRNGCNEWGQRRDHPGDARNQDWYNNHHPYQQYYQWKFRNDDPVYERTQWDQAHGFNPNQYQNWNMNRDWHDPRNRDWAPPASAATTRAATDVDAHLSSPVVNLNVSLAQFISSDKATGTSGRLMKDLSDKPARDVTRDLDTTANVVGPQTPSKPGQQFTTAVASRQTFSAPPALTAAAPTAPPSKVAAGFTAPKLAPVPLPAPTKPLSKPASVPRTAEPEAGPNAVPRGTVGPPKAGTPDPAVSPPDGFKPTEPKALTPSAPEVVPRSEAPQPRQAGPVTPKLDSEPRASVAKQVPQLPPQQQPASEPPVKHAPAPEAPASEAPAPARQAPVRQAPAQQEQAPRPARQAPPVHEAPPPAPAPREAPAPRQAPAPREAPAPRQAPAPREAPAPRAAPAPRQAPAPRASRCAPPMCRG